MKSGHSRWDLGGFITLITDIFYILYASVRYFHHLPTPTNEYSLSWHPHSREEL